MLSNDPDTRTVRDQVGLDLAARLVTTLGDDVEREIADTLLLAFSGAMLQAGMGYFDFDGVVSRVSSAARLMSRIPPA